ncbi:MAG: tRNA lysidine(34) synthetase TilS [Anaerolineae bacterium]
MKNLVERVKNAIEHYKMWQPGQTVIVGVSGGPDSLCLLHILLRLSSVLSFKIHVGHLDHGIRGAESEADAAFVEQIAQRWGLPVNIERADVPALARHYRLALEEAARCARYTFLGRLARQINAAAIAVAHHADDQAETVLMHWLRGAGLAGLRGMLPVIPLAEYRLIEDWAVSSSDHSDIGAVVPPRSSSNVISPMLVRPLLDITRDEIEAYCQQHDLRPRVDRSNLDTTYFRNRLRHELLPYLERYNPNIREVLRRTAQVVAADYALLQDCLERAWTEIVRDETDEAVLLDLAAWRHLPLSLQRSTLRRAVHQLRRALRNINFIHIEEALKVAQCGETGAKASLPQGLLLTVSYDGLLIAPPGYRTLPDVPCIYSEEAIPVHVPGVTSLPNCGWILDTEETSVPAGETFTVRPESRWEAILDAEFVGHSPRLRRRRIGDRFYPLGMKGQSKRLNEFMINEKIPAAWRDHIPLLVNELDQIAWVCGWRPDERARVTTQTRRVMRLRFVRKSI